MFKQVSAFLKSVISESELRPEIVVVERWGNKRSFQAYDYGDDTFIVEKGILDNLENNDPIIMASKADLRPLETEERPYGNVFAISTGNHAVASIPLLDGTFWGLADIPTEQQGDVLRFRIVCCNCVTDTFEISQREVPTPIILEADNWLQSLGCPMQLIVLVDRVGATLDEYRQKGQEWRIKPLAWTTDEMKAAIRASRSRIQTPIKYYHNVKGVHFLTYGGLMEWGELLREKPQSFLKGLEELAAPQGENKSSFIRQKKYSNHHEVELFGLLPGVAEQQLVPEIEALHVLAGENADVAELEKAFGDLAETFRKSLLSPELEDEDSHAFIEALYLHITGEVYDGEPGLITPAFDDRRTPLPGATYLFNTRSPHPGADARTDAIFSYLESNVSHGDRIEYVNIYEIRSESEEVRLGEGKSREIVYKTAWSPVPTRLIEKRLAQRSTGYGTYTMVRAEAFRALGVSFGLHRLLARNDGASGDVHYFVRERYAGESFNQLPAASFHSRDSRSGVHDPSQEDPDIVRAVMALMGKAAAENLTLKKLSPDSNTIRYGEGKEIIEFGYDIRLGKEMPLKVWLCSIRGTMGWPNFECTTENLNELLDFYFDSFATVLANYAAEHPSVPLDELVEAFLDGFETKTRALYWNYSSQRELFDSYNPNLFGDYRFRERWRFVLWSLSRQRAYLAELAELFREKVNQLAGPSSAT